MRFEDACFNDPTVAINHDYSEWFETSVDVTGCRVQKYADLVKITVDIPMLSRTRIVSRRIIMLVSIFIFKSAHPRSWNMSTSDGGKSTWYTPQMRGQSIPALDAPDVERH